MKLSHYIEMAYRGGESYSGRDLLTRSALGQWLYRSGIRDKDTFHFTRQTTVFNKEFPEGRLQMQANISKSDPTIKNRVIKAINAVDPSLLLSQKGQNGWEMVYEMLRTRFGSYLDFDNDDEYRELVTKGREKLSKILDDAGIKYIWDTKLQYFSFPSEITFNKIAWYWTAKDKAGKAVSTTKLNPARKLFSDGDYVALIKEVNNTPTLGKLPAEVLTAISRAKITER